MIAYAVVFVVKQYGVRIAIVRRGYRVVSKVTAYVVLCAMAGKLVDKKTIRMLSWSSVRCTPKDYAM